MPWRAADVLLRLGVALILAAQGRQVILFSWLVLTAAMREDVKMLRTLSKGRAE